MKGDGVCFVCQGSLALFGPYGDYTYFRCRQCKSIQLWPMPSDEQMRQLYATGYDHGEQIAEYNDPEWWRRTSRTYQDAMVATLKDHHEGGTVLDCGAGWGIFVERYLAEGFFARGVEPSEDQSAFARSRGLDVRTGSLDSLREDGQIDTITMFAVFEHLTNHAALLSDAYRLLKPGGLLITAHPTSACYNIVWNLLRLGNKRRQLPYLDAAFAAPWHTALLSIEGTKQIVSRAGFEIIEIRPSPTGRHGGIHGAVQVLLGAVNWIGWKIAGTHWPLVTTHIFVARKVA